MSFPVSNIRRACKIAGITLAELERELKIGNGVIAKWEHSKKSPPYDRLAQIAERFGMTVADLSTPDYPEWEIAASVLQREKEKPAPTNGNGYSEREIAFIELFRRLPEQSQSFVIQQLQGLLLAQKAPGDRGEVQ